MNLQDKLIGALIGLARATDGNEHLISDSSTAVVVDGLHAINNGNIDNDVLENLLHRVKTEKRKMVPNCFECASPCGRTDDYDMANLRNAGEDVRKLKALILWNIRSMASSAYHAVALGHHMEEVERFFYKALIVLGMDEFGVDELMPIVFEMGELILNCVDIK